MNGEVKFCENSKKKFFLGEGGGGGGGGGRVEEGGCQGGCVLRSEAFVKIQFFFIYFFWGGVRVDVNGEEKLL